MIEETQQLLDDLTATEQEIRARGWTAGALINWVRNTFGIGGVRRRAVKDDCGPMCMTGAVGVAVEGDRFIDEVNQTGTSNAVDFEWSERGYRTLEALVLHMPASLRGSQNMARYSNAEIRDLISTIISTNDHSLKNKHDALAWVRTAKAVVSQRLFDLKTEAMRQASYEAQRRAQEQPTIPPKKVIRETAGPAKQPEKQPETA